MITCRCLSQVRKKGHKILLTYLDLIKFIKRIGQQTGAPVEGSGSTAAGHGVDGQTCALLFFSKNGKVKNTS